MQSCKVKLVLHLTLEHQDETQTWEEHAKSTQKRPTPPGRELMDGQGVPREEDKKPPTQS